MAAGAGDDRVHGSGGNNVVAGSDQAGGTGRDLMVDGLGRDFIFGGAGGDAFLYTEAALLGGSNPHDGGRLLAASGGDQ